jgi:hypothetical protein
MARVHDLEREVSQLRQRYAALEDRVIDLQRGKPLAEVPSRSGRETSGVTITHLPEQNPSFIMPSGDELRRLYDFVVARYPRFATRSQHANEAFDGFSRAFLRVGHLSRDKLNDKYALVTWVDDATLWLRNNQVCPSTLTARDFVCAVLAHGDIDYVPLNRFPFDCSSFGLRRDRTGRPATDGWRAILRSGRLREPSRLRP